MGAGHGDALPEAHQFGQHLGPRDDGYALFPSGGQLRVVAGDGAGIHHHIAAVDASLMVFVAHRHAHVFKTGGGVAFLEIRAGHPVAQVAQDLGDAAHAGAAYADEVHMVDPSHVAVFSHGPPPGKTGPPLRRRRGGPILWPCGPCRGACPRPPIPPAGPPAVPPSIRFQATTPRRLARSGTGRSPSDGRLWRREKAPGSTPVPPRTARRW